MSSENTQNGNELSKNGIITLVLSRGLTQLPVAVVGLLLVDIASSFNVEVGIAGQISTAAGLFSIFFGLLMGVLSVRFKHKSLLFTGILLYVLVAVSSYFATSLSMLIGVFSFVGIANATVIPMVNTLVGELVSPDRRASAIGWTVGGMFLIYLIGMLVIGFIATLGWRMAMVLVIVPVGILTGIMCRNYIPDQKKSSDNQASLRDLFIGYKNLLSNKSAIGVILSTILGFSAWYFYVIYGPSYFRQVFNMSASSISIAVIFLMISSIIGSFTVGRLVKRTNEKTVLLSATAFLGVITLIVFRIPSFWVAYFLALIAMFSGGILLTVSNSFALAQIPEYRGTMMSLHAAADSSASAISAGLGGTLLLLYGYGGSSMALGVTGILGALVLYLFTSDH